MVDTETRIRELEHRFRNILTVVRSLVSQSLQAADSIEDARSTIDERLAALGNATVLDNGSVPAASSNQIVGFLYLAVTFQPLNVMAV